VTPRTIRNWLAREGGRCGRPPRGEDERRRAFRSVARTWRGLGRGAGWRPVAAALAGQVPVRLVQESLRAVKRLARRHAARRTERRRVHVEVFAENVLWHQDATHLARVEGDAVQAQVVRDAAQRDVLAASVGGDVTAHDAAELFEAAVVAAGAPPLVHATDNGPPYVAAAFQACLRRHRVVHLRNLPRTPQHNARCERVIRDVKEDAELGSDAADAAVAAACERLAVRSRLQQRPRREPLRYTADDRELFYEAVCRRVADAVQCTPKARARRMAEREAVHAELEERGLIERTRGGARLVPSKAEINS
jgi:transposase InsO family protein